MDDSLSFPPASEWKTWRETHFPVFNHKIFLSHAAVSPLPQHVANAIGNYANYASRQGQFDDWHDSVYFRCKERLAAFLGAPVKASEIAFASSTSHAIGLVATGLPWQSGDNCVVADGDFPANVIPWKNLQNTYDIDVRLIPGKPEKPITIDDLAPLVDENTRIVSLASANFLSGIPLDIDTIGCWLHERNVLFCVDGIQTLGAARFDATHVDFVCADAHKWLLGPNGIAFMWARGDVLSTMRPAILGWLAVAERDHWLNYDTTPFATAERFEPGSRNYTGIVALDAALDIFEKLRMEEIEKRVVELRQYAAEALIEANCKLLWHPDAALPGGIITFQPRNGETASLYRSLAEKFTLSLRENKAGVRWIRTAPHFMNCRDDIDELTAAIAKWQ